MVFSILTLAAILYIAYRVAPKERKEDAHVHGAGQVGLLAAIALFGVDYFTSYFYATGEMMSALHPYGLQRYGYIAVTVISIANFVFGVLYMYSLGVFNEGGGSFTASMRYLGASLSLIVAVVLIQDYILTIVVSTLSGVDQLLSLTNSYGIHWFWHFLIGATLALSTWYLTIRGRGESL
jgi:exosortase/archaeosortase